MIDFKLPEVGENIESGNVVNIAVSIGETITKNQTLLELETDKASLEVPAPCDGTIQEILIKEGDDLSIGQVIMKIAEGESGATPTVKKETPPTQTETKEKEEPKIAQPPEERPKASVPPSPPAEHSIPAQADVPAAPTVRRFAREIGIEISRVPGSGPGGRICEDDVKTFAKQLNTSGGSASGIPATQIQPLPDFSKFGDVEHKALNNIGKKTAQHMSHCWNTIPHVTQFDKADITSLEKLRKRYSTKERKLTITPFLLKVMASALKNFSQFNASIDTNTNEIIYKKYCHIGVAVDTDRGLFVPIIRDVDQKSITELADELNAMAQRARNKKIGLDELQGGSMTLTNLGGIGGTNFTPIVNWPEVAILGVSRGAWEPFYENDHFTPRFRLPLSLSYDHRIINGADGARFLRWICEAIEQPFLMELEK